MLPNPARGAALALAAITAIAGCATEGTPVDLTNREVRLTLLHTSDWHSRLFPYNMRVSATDASLGLQQSRAPFGGVARMNWLIQRERARSDRVLHLDSGDCFQGAPVFNFFSGEAEVRALDATGVDAVLVGNHEFDRGALNFYRQYRTWATFPVLAANYGFDDPTTPGNAELGRLVRPYALFNVRGLRVAVIGMGNLSSISSIFDQPNRPGITPLNTRETAQFYIDQVRAEGADVVIGLTHIGLEDDHRMIESTTGFDVVLGGHLHIVLNPSQELDDCQPVDEGGLHFVPEVDNGGLQRTETCNSAESCCSNTGVCPPEPVRGIPYWRLAPGYHARRCSPRRVVLQHSGAFMKYLGRLDLVFSNNPERIGPDRVAEYQAINRFEVVGHRFTLFPVDSTIPEDPTMARLIEPYARGLDTLANLDTLVGYAPDEVSRTAIGGGDSPLGNLVGTSMWLRLGIQTNFALTNTLGIRDAFPPGPVSIDQVFNVFPFDNSITTMFISGRETREMFDFIARRSSGRGCNSQAQVAGVRALITCGSCDRDGVPGNDTIQGDDGRPIPLAACAETVNIGLRPRDERLGAGERCVVGTHQNCCDRDADCNAPDTVPERRSLCEPNAHQCMQPLALDSSYALAANNFIAAGGSGFFVLQRNTTQIDTQVQLRDSVIDRIREGNPCGYSEAVAMAFRSTRPDQAQRPDDGLVECTVDGDCSGVGVAGEYVCSCAERVTFDPMTRVCNSNNACTGPTGPGGRCVLRACRDDVATLSAQDCPLTTTPERAGERERCLCSAQTRGGESCRILSCINDRVGALADGRLRMVSR